MAVQKQSRILELLLRFSFFLFLSQQCKLSHVYEHRCPVAFVFRRRPKSEHQTNAYARRHARTAPCEYFSKRGWGGGRKMFSWSIILTAFGLQEVRRYFSLCAVSFGILSNNYQPQSGEWGGKNTPTKTTQSTLFFFFTASIRPLSLKGFWLKRQADKAVCHGGHKTLNHLIPLSSWTLLVKDHDKGGEGNDSLSPERNSAINSFMTTRIHFPVN